MSVTSGCTKLKPEVTVMKSEKKISPGASTEWRRAHLKSNRISCFHSNTNQELEPKIARDITHYNYSSSVTSTHFQVIIFSDFILMFLSFRISSWLVILSYFQSNWKMKGYHYLLYLNSNAHVS